MITDAEKDKILSELDKNNNIFLAFMLGLDYDIERSIMQYIKKCGLVTYAALENYFVHREGICTCNRLRKRVCSLLSHRLLKVYNYRGYNFYEIDYTKE